MRFVWDEAKDHSNRRKHGLTFDEASRLFSGGQHYLEIFDEAHSEEEDRFIAIGPVARGLIIVVFTEEGGETVRIISARKATRREVEMYAAYLKGGAA